MRREIDIRSDGTPLVMDEILFSGLESFWKRHGNQMRSTVLRLPDFNESSWEFAYRESEMRGGNKRVPYYMFDNRGQDQTSELRDLVAASQAGGYGIIIDIGCGDSLTPLLVAEAYPNTLVIALDPYNGPNYAYPACNTTSEYPYVARLATQQSAKNSGAFYFPLNAHDGDVQQTLRESAWRVQFVAPDPTRSKAHRFEHLVAAAATFVSPGGEMIVTGDSGEGNAETYAIMFNSKYKIPGSDLWQVVNLLECSFQSIHSYRMTGQDFYRLYGIGDSRYFSTSAHVLRPMKREHVLVPGMIYFSGKK